MALAGKFSVPPMEAPVAEGAPAPEAPPMVDLAAITDEELIAEVQKRGLEIPPAQGGMMEQEEEMED